MTGGSFITIVPPSNLASSRRIESVLSTINYSKLAPQSIVKPNH